MPTSQPIGLLVEGQGVVVACETGFVGIEVEAASFAPANPRPGDLLQTAVVMRIWTDEGAFLDEASLSTARSHDQLPKHLARTDFDRVVRDTVDEERTRLYAPTSTGES